VVTATVCDAVMTLPPIGMLTFPKTVGRLLTIVVSALATTAMLALVLMMGCCAMAVLLAVVGGSGWRYGADQIFIAVLLDL
jgi:hypothetical protein